MEETQLTGRIVTPNDPEYEQARINNNLSVARFPKIIVFCQNTQDVVNALTWVRKKRMPFRVRSGRHSYENFSLVNGGLIIDVSEMNSIKVDRNAMTAKIEAGAALGKVYRQLWKHGATIPAGTEGSVGLVGLTLGGGIGMLTRIFGLTCDNLLEVEMVVASGPTETKQVTASKSSNSDLFWACCGGGGGNFGIVTSLTFKLHPIQNVSIFSITWGWDDFEEAYTAWQTWAPSTDTRLTSEIELFAKDVDRITAQGEFVGSVATLKKLLKPLTSTGSPKSISIKEVTYIEAVRFFDEPSGNEPANRKRSGSFITAPLPLEAILTMKQWLAHAPNEHASLWHQSLGGAAAQIRPEETAYFYRDAIIAQEYLTKWNNPGEERQNVRWIRNVRQALSPYTTGDYVNWPDRFIRNWPKAYYGENFPRLREVKTAYDPTNLFRFPQSIPPYRRRG
ncbi:FAD-binding oxidoreductase [Brevibacillus fluminis]|uniref:FAD-binding oxidoreductase n=1 Tax=Brevibacillus fluminis TaxID=511487 RepID=A0A3M8DV84_9BACL|nr:FAD-binding oxidoreductase [Brevibacillus fluminis]RNB91281.1 FAD-binding oxidoreductase [Brevibacillus fluminis]